MVTSVIKVSYGCLLFHRLSHGQLVALATDVAAGLAYMESMDYVHR